MSTYLLFGMGLRGEICGQHCSFTNYVIDFCNDVSSETFGGKHVYWCHVTLLGIDFQLCNTNRCVTVYHSHCHWLKSRVSQTIALWIWNTCAWAERSRLKQLRELLNFVDFVAREAVTGEKTKQLKQEHQSLINKISEVNGKLKTDGETWNFPFLFNMETHYLCNSLLCKTVTLLISFSNSFQVDSIILANCKSVNRL